MGHDNDSLGLFQQRPGWGTAAQRMDAIESTQLFVDALLRVSGWQSMTPWYAAQSVQRSAFTGRPSGSNGGSSVVGGNYLHQTSRAAAILASVDDTTGTLDCGGAPSDALTPGGPGSHGLPAGFTLPASTSPQARMAVAFALAQLGKPYLWGGNGPGSFDCSGTDPTGVAPSRCRRRPSGRSAAARRRRGSHRRVSRRRPRHDPRATGTLAAPGHVGMYIGQGLVVNAPRTGDVVRVVSYKSFVSQGPFGLRHLA